MIVDIIKSEDGSRYSSSRLWFNLANLAATAAYCYASYNASIKDPINLEGLAWYTLVYMGVVTGNKFANKFLGAKYGTNTKSDKE